MGDRTCATISIAGVLHGADAIQTLVAAIVADGAGENYEPADADQAEDLIRCAVRAGKPVHLSATEVNYGEFDTIEKACASLRLPFIASWENGGDYSAGVKRWTPDNSGEGSTTEYGADNNGTPMARLDEIKTANESGAVDDLLADMALCTSDSLPPLAMEQTSDLGEERDDDHALMPDGTRIEQWDERLRTAGARRVRARC